MSVKITQLEAENIKRIKAVAVTPAANGLTIIGGDNNQGKTTVLDSIAWTLGGDRYRPTNAIRDGSVLPPKLRIELSNGLVVERSGKNSDLKVTDPAGRKAGQQLLNSFVETFALDLPKFMEFNNREKATALLRIIGVEDQVDALDRQEKDLYNQRLSIGRIAEQKEKYAKELPQYPEAPVEPVSAMELIQRQQDILARNGENQRKRQRLSQLEADKERLYQQLQELQERYATICNDCDTAQKSALDLIDESTDALEESLRGIEATNIKVRTNQDKARAEAEAKNYADQYDTISHQIADIRTQRLDLLSGAKLPLAGLSVENGELTYYGKAWDCMSGSDQLKVSTAIVRAINPQCGFVLLDKLEQMDLKTLNEFGVWMETEGLQGIATRVSTGGECSIIIEDGYGGERPNVAAPARESPYWKAGEF